MISYGANLGLMVNAATGEIHDVALRGFLRGVDGLVQPNVKGYLTNTPPGSPSDGDVYIIGAAPTGAWAGKAGKVARWSANDGVWDFYTPKNGWMFQSNSAREVYRYTGGAWEIFYQEGTWEPTLRGGATPGNATHTIQDGFYRRIGTTVLAWFTVRITATGGMAGDVLITGLPHTVEPSNDYQGVFSRLDGLSTWGSGCTFITLSPTGGRTQILIRCHAVTGTINLDSTALSPTTTLVGSCAYLI